VSSKQKPNGDAPKQGLAPQEEEPSAGSMSPSPELEEALREAAEAMEIGRAEREEADEGGEEEVSDLEALRGELLPPTSG
jgi:hypothetical protein